MTTDATHRLCPRCAVLLEVSPDPTGAFLQICPRCDGVVLEAGEVERALRGQLPRASLVDLPSPFAAREDLFCPVCDRGRLRATPFAATSRGVLRCDACEALFLEPPALVALRRLDDSAGPPIDTRGLELALPEPRPVRPDAPAPVAAAEAIRGPVAPPPTFDAVEVRGLRDLSAELAHARFDVADPWARLLGVPVAFLVALPFTFTDFGALLAAPIRIQFHELGHAIVAWLSGRFALPMPCGLTVWTDPPSLGAHLVILLVSALLVARAFRTRTRAPIALAVALEVAHVSVASLDDAIAAILLAGGAAETLLPALAIVAYFLRLPDRLRWDFFRFLVLGAAAIAYLGAMTFWLEVLAGRAEAPLGSLLGTAGDGSGDLERLVREHGVGLDRIVRGYVALGLASGVGILATYVGFASSAIAELRGTATR